MLVEGRVPCAHGRASDGRRLLPCTLVDVAGLVPGAYQGRGKGNQFLHDLTTADCLIHVVDASGTTDAGGNATLAAFDETIAEDRSSTPCESDGSLPEIEIEWVRAEIHQWVYQNVRAKRASWKKRPQKLPGMFSGYGAMPTLIDGVMRRTKEAFAAACGADAPSPVLDAKLNRAGGLVDPVSSVAMAAARSDVELHRLVAHFVAARWPVMIALNKAFLFSFSAFPRLIKLLCAYHRFIPRLALLQPSPYPPTALSQQLSCMLTLARRH